METKSSTAVRRMRRRYRQAQRSKTWTVVTGIVLGLVFLGTAALVVIALRSV